MAVRRKRTFWRVLRVYFRRFRMTVWILLLAVLGALAYLSQVGLPRIIKNPLVAELRGRGLDIQFTRLRVSWIGGVVAENVVFGLSTDRLGPQLTASNVVLNLQRRSLLRLKVKVESLTIVKGHFEWPLANASGVVARTLSVSNIHSSVRLLPNDAWALDNLAAQFENASFELAGQLDHASAIRSWKRSPRKPDAKPPQRVQDRVLRVMEVLDTVRFSSPPSIKLEVRGDAREPLNMRVRFLVSAPDAETPWGRFSDCRFSLRAYPSETNGAPVARLILDAGRGETKWASARNLHLRADGVLGESFTNTTTAKVRLTAESAETRWASAKGLYVMADVAPLPETNVLGAYFEVSAVSAMTPWASGADIHCEGNCAGTRARFVPDTAAVHLRAGKVETKWAQASDVTLALTGSSTNGASADAALHFWTNLHPFSVAWSLRSGETRASNARALQVAVDGTWSHPNLELLNASAVFPDGPVDISAALNAQTRELQAKASVSVNPLQVSALLPKAATRWLSQFTFAGPPSADAELKLVAPEWNTDATNWGPLVLPTMRLAGQFSIQTNGSYRGIMASGGRSHFYYTNRCWLLPDLEVFRPEGKLLATHFANEISHQQYWKLQSTLNPLDIAPKIAKQSKKVMDLLTFGRPPKIEAEVWEWSRQPEKLGIRAQLDLGEFSFRGEQFSGLKARVAFTNNTLLALDPVARLGTQHVSADGFLADFSKDLGYLTNGFSTADPMVIARAIGEQVSKALEPYHFAVPPTLRVEGVIPFRGEEQADLRVAVEGSQFEWLNFNIPKLSGNVHWRGTNLLITKVAAKLYEGDATGYAEFDFAPRQPAVYKFAITTTNTQLKPLVREVFSATNNIEGALSGSLVVTHGTTADWKQWDGYGSLRLRDGLIWDIPVFGAFSPVLNGVSPGMGNSRANSGSLTFNMTNGVMHSTDMEMQASGMRLQYRGWVDLNTRINTRVEAELLRDLGVVGPLVSTVFWPVTKLFEYRITGTLREPKLEPVYFVPKLVLLPFQPFRILKGLFPNDNKDDARNGRGERAPKGSQQQE